MHSLLPADVGWYASNPHTGAYDMKLKAVLTISAVYLAVLGVGFMFAPLQIGIDAVPADASPH
jgi:hypothetical protein